MSPGSSCSGLRSSGNISKGTSQFSRNALKTVAYVSYKSMDTVVGDIQAVG